MCFFLYIVYELLVGLSNATNQESDPVIKGKMDKDLKTKMLVQAQAWQRFWGFCQPPGDPRGQIETREGLANGGKPAQKRQDCGVFQLCGACLRDIASSEAAPV